VTFLAIAALVCECQHATGQSGKIDSKKFGKNASSGNSKLNATVDGKSHRRTGANNADRNKAAANDANSGTGKNKSSGSRATERRASNNGASGHNVGNRNSPPATCIPLNGTALAKLYDKHVNSELARNYTHSDCLPPKYKTTGSKTLRRLPDCPSDDQRDRNHHHPLDFSVQCSSLCQWQYALDVNKQRYPETLHVASCTERNRTCKFIDDGDNSQTSCQEIYINMPVLVQTKIRQRTGECKYDTKFQRIAVGCTCARQRSGNVVRCEGERKTVPKRNART
jgi:hypothetical protein